MTNASQLLNVDEERLIAKMTDYLRRLIAEKKVNGVVGGLSGGVDSAVLFSLLVRSLGEKFVHAMYLYDRDNEWSQGANAQHVADWLNIELEAESLEKLKGDENAFNTIAVRIARISPVINRLIFRLYRLFAKESPFVSSLRAGNQAAKPQNVVLEYIDRYADELYYARHRYRRQILEEEAKAHNWLVLGAANRTEWEVGWFVKGGVDDLPDQPLIGLYKTQVRQMAAYLGVPEKIRKQAPSADMVRGVSDEYAIGMRYSTLDLGLDYLAGGVSLEDLHSAGVTDKDVQRIREMKELSQWKRQGMASPPAIDGSIRGGLRVGY